ncbi:MAG: hypothetical protein AVDCRST_MAG56-1211, partial [uncultured Cytophagales bacterium]
CTKIANAKCRPAGKLSFSRPARLSSKQQKRGHSLALR